jgi:hypothetical protein
MSQGVSQNIEGWFGMQYWVQGDAQFPLHLVCCSKNLNRANLFAS